MVEVATITDVVSIARKSALSAGESILGITASEPAHVSVPDASDPDAVLEWVVDVRLLDGPIQAIFSDDPGLRVIPNVLINHLAVGDVVSDFNVPVELKLNGRTGQIEVAGKSKVALPDLRLDFYSYDDLGLSHMNETMVRTDKVVVDAFGLPIQPSPGTHQATTVTVSITQWPWSYFTSADSLGFGLDPLTGATSVTAFAFSVTGTETITVTESVT